VVDLRNRTHSEERTCYTAVRATCFSVYKLVNMYDNHVIFMCAPHTTYVTAVPQSPRVPRGKKKTLPTVEADRRQEVARYGELGPWVVWLYCYSGVFTCFAISTSQGTCSPQWSMESSSHYHYAIVVA
jgi:hypothetical protein